MAILSPPHLLDTGRWKGMRVGLLGGSFNPPHAGHVHISNIVLNALELDAIWWLVTPQNPLKSSKELLPLNERIRLCREIVDNPKVLISDIETQIGTQYSYHTVQAMRKHFPSTKFAWITGMDNAHTLHHWQKWHRILDDICMVHITRHPAVKLIKNCPSRMLATQNHVILSRGGRVPLKSNTTYWLLQKRMMNISSTQIREEAKRKAA